MLRKSTLLALVLAAACTAGGPPTVEQVADDPDDYCEDRAPEARYCHFVFNLYYDYTESPVVLLVVAAESKEQHHMVTIKDGDELYTFEDPDWAEVTETADALKRRAFLEFTLGK